MKPGKAVIEATNRGFKLGPALPTRKSSLSVYFTHCGLACALLATVLYLSSAQRVLAQSSESQGVRNVILVHGAWADGSSWSKVIPLLEAKGLKVTAVQLPLTSLADDAAILKRAFALEDGPFLLVGHSYGGSVITEAGNDPKVAGLVYVAAFAPDKGQSTLDLITANPTPVGPGLGLLRDFSNYLPREFLRTSLRICPKWSERFCLRPKVRSRVQRLARR